MHGPAPGVHAPRAGAGLARAGRVPARPAARGRDLPRGDGPGRDRDGFRRRCFRRRAGGGHHGHACRRPVTRGQVARANAVQGRTWWRVAVTLAAVLALSAALDWLDERLAPGIEPSNAQPVSTL